MKLFRKSILSFVVVLCCIMACQHEEVIAPQADDAAAFVAGNIATVKITDDFEVNFIEPEPGLIITAVNRSIGTHSNESEVFDVLRGTDYLEAYKKLAGKQIDQSSLKRLQGALLRQIARAKRIVTDNNPVFPRSVSQDLTAGRTMACSGGNTGSQWFVTNKWNRTKGNLPGVPADLDLNQTVHSEFSAPGSGGRYEVDVMNGQASNSGNKIRFQWNNEWSFLMNAWTVSTVNIPSNSQVTVTVSFPTGLNCPSIHTAYHWFSN